jgi:hypothetical protein
MYQFDTFIFSNGLQKFEMPCGRPRNDRHPNLMLGQVSSLPKKHPTSVYKDLEVVSGSTVK